MPKYSYIAVGADGKEKKGVIESTDEISAAISLKSDGYIPISIVKPTVLTKEINILQPRGVKPRELSVFCRQMNSILDSGITIVKALDMLSQQITNKSFREALDEARAIVEKGESLSSALGQNPKIFPALMINMVEAGEASGTLDTTFERLAIHFEKASKLKAMVGKALVYPSVLMVIAAGVVVIMTTVIVPKFVALFDSLGTELPAITRFVVGISNLLIHQWYLVIMALVLISAAIKYSKTTAQGRYFWDSLKLKMPIFGKLRVKNICASFSRTMGTLLGSGISLSQALDITGRSLENVVFMQVLENARREIERGTTLSEPLRESGKFPVMVYQMLSIGEETGNIEGMLEKVADYYEEEVEIATGALNAAMEPLIIVVMGVVIGFIAVAIYMPIISMYSGLENL